MPEGDGPLVVGVAVGGAEDDLAVAPVGEDALPLAQRPEGVLVGGVPHHEGPLVRVAAQEVGVGQRAPVQDGQVTRPGLDEHVGRVGAPPALLVVKPVVADTASALVSLFLDVADLRGGRWC